MARLSDQVRSLLGYWWNLVNDAAKSGFTVTDTIQLAQQVSEDNNVALKFEDYSSISSLYGYARREINAAAVFTAADANAVITPDMISSPPYARDVQEQNAYPIYHVKFEYTYIDSAGNVQTEIKTSAQPLTLGPTIADVTADVLDDAESFANKYGHTLVSAVPIAILAV